MALAPLIARVVIGGRAGVAARTAAATLFESKSRDEETVAVSSSAISQIGYRSDDTISVTFRRGGTYLYSGSRDLYEQFKNAPSKGQFFNANFQK